MSLPKRVDPKLSKAILDAANKGNLNEVRRLIAVFQEKNLEYVPVKEDHFYTPLLSALRSYLKLFYLAETPSKWCIARCKKSNATFSESSRTTVSRCNKKIESC
jgi:hypothetical protein